MGGKEFRIPEGILQDGTGGIKRSGTVCKVSRFPCADCVWTGTDLIQYEGIQKEVSNFPHQSLVSNRWRDLLHYVHVSLTDTLHQKNPGWSALGGIAHPHMMPWISSAANPPNPNKSWNHFVCLCDSPLPNLLAHGMASRLCRSGNWHTDGWQIVTDVHHDS